MAEEANAWTPLRVLTLLIVCVETVLALVGIASMAGVETDAAGEGIAQAFVVILAGMLVIFTLPALILAARGTFLLLAFVLSLMPIVGAMVLII